MLRILSHTAARFADLLGAWHDRNCQRRALIALSDRALHDIGVGWSEALAEYAKPFWRN